MSFQIKRFADGVPPEKVTVIDNNGYFRFCCENNGDNFENPIIREIFKFCLNEYREACTCVKENHPDKSEVISGDLLRRYLSASGNVSAFYDVMEFLIHLEEKYEKR